MLATVSSFSFKLIITFMFESAYNWPFTISNLGFSLNAQLAESTKIQFEIVERWPQKPIMTKLLLHLDYAQVNFILFLEFWCNFKWQIWDQ